MNNLKRYQIAPIPGYFEEFAQYWGWSKTQVIAYLSADYLIIALYGFLLLIALRNAWVILYKQSEYKKILILAFYSFAILAVSLRLIIVIEAWTMKPFTVNMEFVETVAKLCVGIV